jgi:hypothetical protein
MKIGLRLVTVAMLVAMPAMLVAPQVRAESTLNKILKEKKIRVAIEVGNPFDICDAPAVGIDSTAPDPTLVATQATAERSCAACFIASRSRVCHCQAKGGSNNDAGDIFPSCPSRRHERCRPARSRAAAGPP